jgi:hypothetical protein
MLDLAEQLAFNRDLHTGPGGKELRSPQFTDKNERPLVDENGMQNGRRLSCGAPIPALERIGQAAPEVRHEGGGIDQAEIEVGANSCLVHVA